jgi:CDP-diacylglycerol--serine O-phosphatidyltransferase
MKKHIPNFITSLNLFSGCVAAYLAFKGNYPGAFIAILFASAFDFLDGFAARLLKAYSPMGKELDSLADMVSFGLAPGAIVFSLLSETGINVLLPFLGFLIPVFSGLRLAKFNIDDRQTTSFIGLPVPANAIFWAGLVYSFSPFLLDTVWLLIILIGVFSYLLISEIPMFSLKFRNVSWTDNQTQYIFLIGCVAILGYFQTSAFSIIIGWYIASSIGVNLSKKFK